MFLYALSLSPCWIDFSQFIFFPPRVDYNFGLPGLIIPPPPKKKKKEREKDQHENYIDWISAHVAIFPILLFVFGQNRKRIYNAVWPKAEWNLPLHT